MIETHTDAHCERTFSLSNRRHWIEASYTSIWTSFDGDAVWKEGRLAYEDATRADCSIAADRNDCEIMRGHVRHENVTVKLCQTVNATHGWKVQAQYQWVVERRIRLSFERLARNFCCRTGLEGIVGKMLTSAWITYPDVCMTRWVCDYRLVCRGRNQGVLLRLSRKGSQPSL